MKKILLSLLTIGLLTSSGSARPERQLIDKSHKFPVEIPTLLQTEKEHLTHHVFFTCYQGQGEIAGAAYQKVIHLKNSAFVHALPNPGYKFTEWDDGCKDNPRRIYSVDQDHFYFAKFTAID